MDDHVNSAAKLIPMGVSPPREERRVWGKGARIICAAVLLCACAVPAPARSAPSKLVRYHGLTLVVPSSWPVYDLSADRRACLRFDRHAVFLGQPSSEERCPARAVGRTEAIWLRPKQRAAKAAASDRRLPAVTSPDAQPAGGSSAVVALPAHDLLATVTWNHDPVVLERALGVGSLPGLAAVQARRALPRSSSREYAPAAAAAAPGAAYTGPGFDACTAPSEYDMSAWRTSRYRAVGIYIGGTNMGCAQPNLTPGWVSQESAAGWHLMPIYVGLQAPSNQCGCAGIDPSQASAEGAAAASDAARQAQALGLGVGNPIYFDMEGYVQGGNTSAVMTFLAAWTNRLHSEGYRSGVYSSVDSGISDLVARYGTGYREPDDIWFAFWNGQQTTSTGYIPAGDWSSHQRLHQYNGGSDETYGGVTMNIDGDYADASTAASGSGQSWPTAPYNGQPPRVSGTPDVGGTLTAWHGRWWGTSPISYRYRWQRCTPACVDIPAATRSSYVLTERDAAERVRVVVSAFNRIGHNWSASTLLGPVKLVVAGGGYWRFTRYGDVDPSPEMTSYGSPAASGVKISSITGMAATTDGKGYWIVDGAGDVYPYGDAGSFPPAAHSHPIVGMVAAPAGGYWLYTAAGNIYPSPGTSWYGAPYARGVHTTVSGMAATPDGKGYWLVDIYGNVYRYGDAAQLPVALHGYAIRGVAAAPRGGFWLFTAHGNVYPSRGAPWYGSPYADHVATSTIIGVASTPDGKGYWVLDASGAVHAYGDAPGFAVARSSHRFRGITSG